MRTVHFLCFLLSLLALSDVEAKAAQRNAEAEHYVRDARAYIEAGEPSAAIIQLKNALRENPDDPEARYLLGSIYVSVGDSVNAEKELTRARDLGYDPDAIARPLGQALLIQRKFRTIVDSFDAGLHEGPRKAEILLIRAAALFGLERWEQTDTTYAAAVPIVEDPRPLLGRARVSFARGDLQSAGRFVEAALRIALDDVAVLLAKAHLLRVKGKLDAALVSLDHASGTAPDDPRITIARATVLIDAGRVDEALRTLSGLVDGGFDLPIVDHLTAVALANKKDYEGARSTLQKSWRALEANPPSLFLSALIHYGLGELERAESDLRSFQNAAPGSADANLLLGAILLRKDDAAAALPLLRSAADAAPEDSRALGLYANALLKTGAFTQAAEAFQKAAELAPDTAASHTGLAVSRLALGDTDQAVKALSDAVDLQPSAEGPTIFLVLTLLRQGRHDDALSVLDDIEANLPNDPLVQNLRAVVQLSRKDVASAEAHLRAAIDIDPEFHPAVLNLALILMAQGRLDEAEALYLGALGEGSMAARVLTGLADVALRQNRVEDAAVWLNRAREANTADLASRVRLLDVYPRLGQIGKMQEVLREVRGLGGERPVALRAEGQAYLGVGEPANAVPPLRRLVEVTGGRPQDRLLLAHALVASNDGQGARRLLRETIDAAPGFAPAYIELAMIEERAGRSSEADALVAALRAQLPGSYLTDALHGALLIVRRQYEDAVRTLEASWRIKPTPKVAVDLYRARSAAGHHEAAQSELEEWVSKNPGDRNSSLLLGGVYLESGRLDGAVAIFERLHADHPDDPVVLNELAWVYQSKGDRRAIEFAERAHRLVPGNPLITDTLGWIAFKQGQVTRSVELLEEAVAAAPSHPELRYHLAVALDAAGQSSKAATHLRILLRDHKGSAQEEDARALYEQIEVRLGR